MFPSKLRKFLIGDPLHNSQHQHELLPKWKALAILSADALSSTAYATEEIIIPLTLVGVASATLWSLPISIAILSLMLIVALSYQQTIKTYPNGGGAYTVAKENLGVGAGLVAGAALLIDYTLTVAVSVSAGVENLVSAFPGLASIKVFTCVWIILLIMILSLRGVKDSASIFAFPTYFFIFSMIILVIVGLIKGPVDTAIHPHEVVLANLPDIGLLMILRAFSSGCTALTGIEAISNGIPLFRHPQSKNARTTLIMMIAILGTLFAGITYLVNSMDLTYKPGVTLISQLNMAINGSGVMYYFVQISIFLILFMAASTAYADFPRLASLLAKDRYLPKQLSNLGDRLVYSNGVIGLSLSAIILIIIFHGSTHSLIPLYAIGAFLSFTLSQAGMVVHHWKYRENNWIPSMLLNGLGATITGVVLIIIAGFKFMNGAWIVLFVLPFIIYFLHRIHVHYVMFARELSQSHYDMTQFDKIHDHVVIIPISGIHKGVIRAVRYGLSIGQDVRVCYVKTEEAATERLLLQWNDKFPNLKLHILESPYRAVAEPIIDFINQASKEHPTELTTVIFPEFMTAKWHHQLLHNQTAWIIKMALIYKKNIVVTSVKYHLTTT